MAGVAYALAFEHTGSAALAAEVERLARKARIPTDLLEIATLSTRFSLARDYLRVLGVDKSTFDTESRRLLFLTKHLSLRDLGAWLLKQADAHPVTSASWIPTARALRRA